MNNQTIEKLRSMRLSAMADMHSQLMTSNQQKDMTIDEYLAILVDHEHESRTNQKIIRLRKNARFKQQAHIDDINYGAGRNLDKNAFQRLSTLTFMSNSENIIITGPSGVGKSYIAQALGNQACLHGKKTIYSITSRLLTKLKLAKADGTYIKELAKLEKTELIILDDFGLQAFNKIDREILLDIIEDRFGLQSMIIASQVPVSVWYDLIGEGTIADAILDRVLNSSHRIDLKGDSLRKGIIKE